MKKIDSKGRYIPHPGITVIHKVIDIDLAGKIYSILMNEESLLKSYQPLPASSYHMTLCDLYSGVNWREKVDADRLIELDSFLKAKNYCLTVKVIQMYVRNTLGFLVEVQSHVNSSRQFLRQALGLSLDPGYQFHITLAYKYGPVADASTLSLIHSKLDKILALHDYKIVLGPATLCLFNDMTAFYPYKT